MTIQNTRQKKPAFYVVLFTLLIVIVCCVLLLLSLSVPELGAALGDAQVSYSNVFTLAEKIMCPAGWFFTCA